MENKKKMGLYMQIAIFFMAIPASLSQLAAPVAAQIGAAFNMTVSQIGLITSLPSLAMLFTQLLCAYLITKCERKVLITIGFLAAVLGGIGPAFVGTAAMVLFCRVLMGLGLGLCNPISTTYIAQFPLEQRPKITARWQFTGSAGGAAIMALVGPVSKYGWKAVLMLYLVIAVFIATSLTAFPTTGPLKKESRAAAETNTNERVKLPFEFYAGYAVAFIMMFIYVGMTAYLSMYVADAGLKGSELLSGSALTLARLIGAFGALLVPVLLKKFKAYLGAFACVLCVIAALVYTIPNAITILLGYSFVYWSSVVACVACSTRNATLLPLHRVAFGQAMLTTILYLGQFLSTYAVNGIASLLHVPVTSKTVIYCLLIPLIIVGIIGLPRKPKTSKIE